MTGEITWKGNGINGAGDERDREGTERRERNVFGFCVLSSRGNRTRGRGERRDGETREE